MGKSTAAFMAKNSPFPPVRKLLHLVVPRKRVESARCRDRQRNQVGETRIENPGNPGVVGVSLGSSTRLKRRDTSKRAKRFVREETSPSGERVPEY